jgi:putative sterol carrier protein
MKDSTKDFFDGLAQRGHEPLLRNAEGTIRFDVTDGDQTERVLLTINHGDLSVSHKNVKADCVIHADRKMLESIMSGKANAMAAVLRGAIQIEGDPELLILTQRLFPGPQSSEPATAGYARRMS